MCTLRAARSTDAGTTGEILYRFMQETEWMPKLHTLAETIAFCGTMIDRGWVTVAELEGRVEGFMARDGQEICALYLSNRGRRRGIGPQLLQMAKDSSDRLWLKAFEANGGAQRFYLRNGFKETARSDGAGNDENLLDITYVWEKETPQYDPRPGSDRSGE